jgi:hypothetical protein
MLVMMLVIVMMIVVLMVVLAGHWRALAVVPSSATARVR